MKLKMILVAALALVLASCQGGGAGTKTPAKTQSVKSSFKAFETFRKIPSLLSTGVRLQAGPETYQCTTGSITFTTTGDDSSATITLRTPTTGCTITEGGESATISTNGADFTMTFSLTQSQTSTSFRLQFNGTLSVGGTGVPTETFTYNSFSITITVSSDGKSGSVNVNGSVQTPEDGLQSFNSETYTFDELGESL